MHTHEHTHARTLSANDSLLMTAANPILVQKEQLLFSGEFHMQKTLFLVLAVTRRTKSPYALLDAVCPLPSDGMRKERGARPQ
jgi:hypothetical protein